jgi:acetoin utilization protein AcuC
VPHAVRYGLGPGDNPIFPGLWEAAQLAAGGSIVAARLVAEGEVDRAFHFAGGLHHAMPDRASGFCYVNDAVLAIMTLRERGLKVAYVDIDAHHGDGVQFAFYDDPTVLTISTHERGDRLFPGSGFVDEMGEGAGVGYSVNLPLQPFTDDAVYEPAFEAVVPPLLRAFRPDALVIQLGIDAHRTDPLTHLALSIQGFLRSVRRLLEFAPRVVALGGGGYDIANVARAWTGSWAAINDMTLPEPIPAVLHADLHALGLESMTLSDPPAELDADTRRWAVEFAARQVRSIREEIFPGHGL